MKKLLVALVVLVVVFAGLSFGKNMAAKVAVERGVEMVTGLQLCFNYT